MIGQRQFRSTHATGFEAGFSFLYTRADKRVNTPILRNLSNPRPRLASAVIFVTAL
jgi:hypothetical protein